MITEFASSRAAPTPDPLRRKIGWLCQFVRFAALAYAGWVCWTVATLWLDRDRVSRAYGTWLKADLSGLQDWQMLAGFAVHTLICAFVLAACRSTWQLFSGYLQGRIFTLDAAIWLRRIGFFGLLAEIADIITRPILSVIISAHLPAGHRMVGIAVNQNDLAFLMLLTAILALAHIFTKAAELAAENEAIV
jgi:hypothetical protein